MNHEKIRNLLGAYHDGEVKGNTALAIESHLRACRECQEDLTFLKELDKLPKAAPSVPDEAGYWASFAGRVTARIGEKAHSGARVSRVVEDQIFRDSFVKTEKDMRLKAIVFPLSVIAHAVVVLLLILMPMFKTVDLPQVEIYSTFLAPPLPPPPPPPPPAKKKAGSTTKTRIRAVQTVSFSEAGRLIAPVDIPEEIAEEEISDVGVEGGIEGGVEGGVVGGVLGGVVGGVLGGVIGDVEAPIRASGNLKPPKLIKQVDPVYPDAARQARVEGTVILQATTDIYGRVQDVKILRSIPLLDQAAIDAVRQWVYEPMIVNGRPRGVLFMVTVNFQLR